MGSYTLSERFWNWVALHLPRKLVYFAGIRLWVHGTGGEYENTDVTGLLMVDALKRWDKG
jgi:hypothetical protein